MGELFDYFSRRKVKELPYIAHRAQMADQGRYVGVLPKDKAAMLRTLQDAQAERLAQVNEWIAEYDAAQEHLRYLMVDAMTLLQVYTKRNPSEVLCVDDAGHCWLVDKKGNEG